MKTKTVPTATQPTNMLVTSKLTLMLIQTLSITAVFLLFEVITFFPESSRSSRSMNIIIPSEQNVSGFLADKVQSLHTCRTNFPIRLWLSVVHPLVRLRIAISLRRGRWRMSSIEFDLLEFGGQCLVPHQFQLSCPLIAQNYIILTSDLAVSVRIPRGMEASRRPREVYNRQPRALEIAPV
jgi:hypothetical protein